MSVYWTTLHDCAAAFPALKQLFLWRRTRSLSWPILTSTTMISPSSPRLIVINPPNTSSIISCNRFMATVETIKSARVYYRSYEGLGFADIIGFYRNTLCLSSKILQKHCFQFLLGFTVVPRENKSNSYAKFWRANKEYYE